METSIHKLIEKHGLLEHGDRVLVGVSGGPDSMALLHWLWQHQEQYGIEVSAVHVNHQLRGQSADEDEEYVERVCAQWGIPCISQKADVFQFAQKHRVSKQVAARECRYAIFAEAARQLQANKLALAHHADDQIETVMMRLVRGAGLGGMSGMPVKRETPDYTIIRPFMSIPKKELEQYCQLQQISPRIDESNASDLYTRNWVRHHLVPLMLQLNPNLHQVIYETTDLIQAENKYLNEQARKYVKDVIESESVNKMTINLSSFQKIPLPLQRRAILLILNYLLTHKGEWNKIHIDQVLELISNPIGNKQLMLPHQLHIIREYQSLHVHKDFVHAEQEKQDDYEYILPTVGEYDFQHLALKVSIFRNQAGEGVVPPIAQQQWMAHFDADELCMPFVLRNRRAGDRIQPLGMDGHKKVKDIFIDEKIPVSLRHNWPIMEDQRGIIWLPGLKKAERGKVTKKTVNILTVIVAKV